MYKKIYLMGGLGNVLFQINYAHNLKDHGFDVVLNVYLLRENFITKNVLGWSSHDTLSSLHALDLISSFKVEERPSIYFIFGFLSKFFRNRIFNCQYFGLISPDFKILKATHLFGYFHIKNPINSRFVTMVKRAIEKKLHHPDLRRAKENLMKIGNSWVIHIRGGDYKLDQNFTLDINYYIEATNNKTDFYIVTNDRKYSKEVMSNLNLKFHFVSSSNALEDFIILVMSDKKILANSTFSWWAAEFGNSDSLVIQREPFYNHVEWNPMTLRSRQRVGRIK